MPLYDYNCKGCGSTFEVNKKISERDEVKQMVCPSCSEVGNIERGVAAAILAYSVTTKGGYGTNLGGFKEVLNRINERTAGSKLDKLSSYDFKS